MTTIGTGTCPICGLDGVPIKVSKKNHLYLVCLPAADGGCDNQAFARGPHSDRLYAERVTKWSNKEAKEKWLSNAPQPEPEPVDPEPEPDGLIEDEPPPPPPAPRPRARTPAPRVAPKKPAAKPAPQPAKKNGWLKWE